MIKRVTQSREYPQNIKILLDKVLIATNVHEIIISDIDNNDSVMYEYDMIEYSNKEYTKIISEQIAETEDALCEEDSIIDERLGTIEDVLCEIDERINGGE